MEAILYVLGAVLIGAFGAILFLWKNEQKLGKILKEKTESLDSTSKLLLEKHLELTDQNIRLQKLLEAKVDFINIASHQLRTPQQN